MVTKPTGRPRGRPNKTEPPPARKGKRGRPRTPLPEDEQRYTLAFLHNHINRGRSSGLSERKLVDHFATLRHGKFIPTRENSLALLNRRPFAVQFERDHFVQGAQDSHWRGKNAFRPLADNLYRKYRNLCKRPDSAQWLNGMSSLWDMCFEQDPKRLSEAQELAEVLGEREYFEQTMRPILLRKNAVFERVRRFVESGDDSYWLHNRLRAWADRTVTVTIGDKLLKRS